MRRLTLCCILLTFMGCASHLNMSTKYCAGADNWLVEYAVVKDFTDQKTFDEKFLITAGLGVEDIQIRELLQQKKIDCKNLTSLMVTVYSNWVDALISFIPFVVFKEVRLRGTYIAMAEQDPEVSPNNSLDVESVKGDSEMPKEDGENLNTVDEISTMEEMKELQETTEQEEGILESPEDQDEF